MKPLRVFIDGLFFRRSGIGRYYEFLVRSLSRSGLVGSIHTTIDRRTPTEAVEELRRLSKVEVVKVGYPYYSPSEFVRKGGLLRRLEGEHGVRVFHFPQVNLPLILPRNIVVTIHDLIPLLAPGGLVRRSVFGFMLRRALRVSRAVITVSNATKQAVIERYPDVEEKITVIYPASDMLLTRTDRMTERLVTDRYIVYVGNRKPHKNLAGVVRAFSLLRRRLDGLKLVVAGTRFSRPDDVDLLKGELGLGAEVIEFESPSDADLADLYANAEALVLPSFHEGFGIPPLEAMKVGIPAVVSDIPVLREVCERAAYFVDPSKADDIADGIHRVITDRALRQSLIDAGRDRIRFFQVQDTVGRHLEIYNRVRGV
jgi:glycosyltransferase involved in cell wall biosynthesis